VLHRAPLAIRCKSLGVIDRACDGKVKEPLKTTDGPLAHLLGLSGVVRLACIHRIQALRQGSWLSQNQLQSDNHFLFQRAASAWERMAISVKCLTTTDWDTGDFCGLE